ncbi:putative immunoglobulin-blocking virulence protein [Mycoplasma tullyi]|uniref:Putative immunoglobulin-blocking virulence protein n=1 Tax=Mycoplasma tullyi TaxID=1612150 RepID=A0A7D7U3J0_9MOLU|nr:putative immunoglobulin-blocking virulence protein [Mycoplasma tullyi]QMT98511.1 putative immunoglobulin-blocking virulence protein [Mycoplasma tullyi]
MVSSKKRKIIKLIAFSTGSITLGAASTLGIVYSTYKSDSQTSLIQRSNQVTLDSSPANTDASQNSNRDFNLENAPKVPEKKPVAINPPEKKPEPKPEPTPPATTNNLAANTQIQYVTYEKQEYNLDKNTPQQPNDPSRQVLNDQQAQALLGKTRASLTKARDELLKAINSGGTDDAARDAFRQISGYKGSTEFFNNIWKTLFTKNDRGQKPIDDLLLAFNLDLGNNKFLLDESKANRTWRINLNENSINISYGYENDGDNPVYNYYKKVNEYKVLGYPNYQYNPTPSDIINGDFRGWTKTDITNTYINDKDYGIDGNDGIQVRHYTPTNKDDPYYKNKDDLNVFELDVDNTSGYDKFIKFIKKVYEKEPNKKIGVVLRNVGKTNTTRNVYDILQALPQNVETLTVFLDGANTTSLLALENRKLRELNIYTTGRVNTDLWGINPLAIRHINFIPSLLAYNVAGFGDSYATGTTIGSTPIFTTLKFDRNDDYKRVQEGIDIAFDRRSERIFQGNFQGQGAKPIFWDFADAPIIRNLKNLNVRDAELRFVRLSADLIDTDNMGNSFVTYDLNEFNHSQWTAAMRYRGAPGDKLKISFGRGTEIAQPRALVLRGAQNTLEQEGLDNLKTFVKYATNSGAFKDVFVSTQFLANEIQAAAASEGNSITVHVVPLETLDKYQIKTFTVDPKLNAIGDPIKPTK